MRTLLRRVVAFGHTSFETVHMCTRWWIVFVLGVAVAACAHGSYGEGGETGGEAEGNGNGPPPPNSSPPPPPPPPEGDAGTAPMATECEAMEANGQPCELGAWACTAPCIHGIASDGMNVYISQGSSPASIKRCAVGGCNMAFTTVVPGLGPNAFFGNRMAVGGNALYWTNLVLPSPGDLMDVPLDSVMPIAANFWAPESTLAAHIVTDETFVYWSQISFISSVLSQNISRCDLGASCATPTVLFTDPTASDELLLIAVDTTYLYWEIYDLLTDSIDLYSKPLAGGPTVSLVTNSGAGALVASSGNAYWVSAGGIYTCPGNATAATCPAGGNLYASDPGAGALATDGTMLYWGTAPTAGAGTATSAMRKCALGATCPSPTTLLSGLVAPKYIVLDAMHTYWIAEDFLVWKYRVYEYSK